MNRIKWFDIANVLSMIAVVWFHIPSAIEEPVRYLEYISVNIPFFFLSGYAFALSGRESMSFGGFASHLCKRLVVPTVVFYLFFYILWVVAGKAMAGDTEQWYVPLMEFIRGNFQIVLASYWFVVCLITIQIIYYSLSKINKPILVPLCCGLLPLFTLFLSIPDCFELRKAVMFIPVFAIGSASCDMSNNHKKLSCLCLIIIGWMLFFVCQNFVSTTCLYNLTDVMSGFLLLVFIFLVSHLNVFDKIMPFVSICRYGALIILATQNYIIGVSKVCLDKVFSASCFLANHIWAKPIVLLAVYIITIPVIILVKKKTPFVLCRNK